MNSKQKRKNIPNLFHFPMSVNNSHFFQKSQVQKLFVQSLQSPTREFFFSINFLFQTVSNCFWIKKYSAMFTKIQLNHWNFFKLVLTSFLHIIYCLVPYVDSLDQTNRSFSYVLLRKFSICEQNRKIEPFTSTFAPELIGIVGRRKCLKKFLSLFVGSVGPDALVKQTMAHNHAIRSVYLIDNNGI